MGEIVTVEVARGTPHGRDKERWGHGGGRNEYIFMRKLFHD